MVRLAVVVINWIYISKELIGILKNNVNFHILDVEFYNLQPERSTFLFDYDYDALRKNNPNEEVVEMPLRLESLFYSNKYDTPLTTIVHQKDYKTTVIYMSYQQPNFSNLKYFPPFGPLNKEFPMLKVPFEAQMLAMPHMTNLIPLFEEFRQGGVLPQVVLIKCIACHADYAMNSMHARALIDLSDGCYQYFDRWQYSIG